jgi:hypothetical protein
VHGRAWKGPGHLAMARPRDGRGPRRAAGDRRQWALAPAAPMPVCERTNWASKASFSAAAARERSIRDTSQITAKASVIENRAGLL